MARFPFCGRVQVFPRFEELVDCGLQAPEVVMRDVAGTFPVSIPEFLCQIANGFTHIASENRF